MSEVASTSRADRSARPSGGPKVLQVLPALVEGGVERGTIEIARFLVSQGWRAAVGSSGGPSEAALEGSGTQLLHLPLSTKSPLGILANGARLQKLIRRHGVQLVHARSRAPAWSAWLAARRCGVPFVTTCHGVYSGSGHWLKHRYNAIMARGDRVIAPSEYVAEHLRERYGVGSDRLRVIQRGVDLDLFDPAAVDTERTRRLAQKWDIPPGMKVLMLPGRITRIKGHTLLLQALRRVPKGGWLCLMVGGADPNSGYVREVRDLIGAEELGKSVRLTGACDDMPAALALADVVVVPSIGHEAFGRVSVEAQAMGRPVIVTNFGGLSETLMPAATGWLVPPDDADEIAQAIQLALEMPEESRARLAVRARDFVVRHFSSERMARKTLAVYRELLGSEPGRLKHEQAGPSLAA